MPKKLQIRQHNCQFLNIGLFHGIKEIDKIHYLESSTQIYESKLNIIRTDMSANLHMNFSAE